MFAAGVGLVIVQKFMQNGALRTMLLRFAAFTCFMVLSLWGVLMLTPLVSIPLTVAIILRTLALVIVFVLGCLGTGLLRKDDIGLLLNVVKASS